MHIELKLDKLILKISLKSVALGGFSRFLISFSYFISI